MIYKFSLFLLALSIILGLYPNVMFLKFGIYALDIVVFIIFVQSIFVVNYRRIGVDIFLLIFFLINFVLLLANFKFLISLGAFVYLCRFCIYLGCYPYFGYIFKKIPYFAVKTYILTLYISLLLNFVVFLIYPNLNIAGFDPHKFRLYGQFLDPNYYSVFLAINLHFILALSSKQVKFKPILVFLLFLSLLATLSRLGLICLCLVLFLNFSRKYISYTILITLAVVLLGLTNISVLNRVLFIEGNMDSFLFRIYDLLDGVKIYKNSIIPSGFNNMQIYNNYLTSNINNSSSFYDFWPINLILSGSLALCVLFAMFFTYLQSRNSIRALGGALFIMLLAGLGMNILFYPIFTLCFSVVIGVILNKYRTLN